MLKKVLEGTLLEKNEPPLITDPLVVIDGACNGKREQFCMDETALSRHTMLIGCSGCGKTNTFFFFVEQLKAKMTEDDVMIIFDTKGDYYERFYSEGDFVISTSDEFKDVKDKWNIYREILLDGFDKRAIEAAATEIAWGLYSEVIEKNSSNPFFPNAARDLFSSILTCSIRHTDGKKDKIDKYLDNEFLRKMFDSMKDSKKISQLLGEYSDQASVMNYIGDGKNDQGLGVLAEMQNVVRNVFVGAFAEKGEFSVRQFVRNRGAKTLFIEYDISRGSTLTPIYKLLVDLALKEAMGRKSKDKVKKGNVYIFCDEFKLLPHLKHIDDAVNFGRSLGVKIFAGLQSIDQLVENYGESRSKNLIAGFSTVISFRANDEGTRRFISGRYGDNYIIEQRKGIDPKPIEEKRMGKAVEDWELIGLDDGEAIVGILKHPPYKFYFDKYGRY